MHDINLPWWAIESQKSHDPSIKLSCEITLQTKTITSLLRQYHRVLYWGIPTDKVIWIFDHLVLKNPGTNWDHNISIFIVPMDTKLGRVLTCLNVLLFMESHGFLGNVMLLNHVTINNIISPLTQCLRPLKFAGW